MGQDRTSIHKPEYCLPGQGFTIDLREVVTLPVAQPHPYDLPVMKLTTSKTALDRNGREVPLSGGYIYWFVADGKLATHHRLEHEGSAITECSLNTKGWVRYTLPKQHSDKQRLRDTPFATVPHRVNDREILYDNDIGMRRSINPLSTPGWVEDWPRPHRQTRARRIVLP